MTDERVNKRKEKDLIAKVLALFMLLKYELAPGVHTRHQCECDERPARGSKCFMCLIEELYDENVQ